MQPMSRRSTAPKPAKPEPNRGAKQNSSSAVRAILDDPPMHIRPVCSRKRGCEGQEPCGFRPWLHSSATPATRFFAHLVTSQLVRDYAFYRRGCEKVAPAGQFEAGVGCLNLPSMTDGLSTLYQDLLGGSYDCVDRIVLNAYSRMGHDPGGFRVCWRALTG